MSDLVRAFERFIGRDLVFILAGTMVFICIGRIICPQRSLREFVRFENGDWVWIVPAVGFAYIVGYAVQELFSLLRVSSTAIEVKPRCFEKRLFKWYHCREGEFGPDGGLLAQIRLQRFAKKSFAAHVERMTYLMQVGTALGPASVLGGALLIGWRLLDYFGCFPNRSTKFDLFAGAALLFFGALLLLTGAIKRLQLREYVYIADKADQEFKKQDTGNAGANTVV